MKTKLLLIIAFAAFAVACDGAYQCHTVSNNINTAREQARLSAAPCEFDNECVTVNGSIKDCSEICGSSINRANYKGFSNDLAQIKLDLCPDDFVEQCGLAQPSCLLQTSACINGYCEAIEIPAEDTCVKEGGLCETTGPKLDYLCPEGKKPLNKQGVTCLYPTEICCIE